MEKKTLDLALDGCLRLEEETLSDGNKAFSVRFSGDYSCPATSRYEAKSFFLAIARLLRK